MAASKRGSVDKTLGRRKVTATSMHSTGCSTVAQIKASGSGDRAGSSRTARLEHLRERAPSSAGTSSRASVAGQCQEVLVRTAGDRNSRLGHRVMDDLGLSPCGSGQVPLGRIAHCMPVAAGRAWGYGVSKQQEPRTKDTQVRRGQQN